MSQKEYLHQIRFTVEDLAKFPSSPLSKKCARALWEKERDDLAISELFVLDAVDGSPELSELLFRLFYTMIKDLYNEKKCGPGRPALEDVEEESRVPFEVSFDFSMPYRKVNLPCRADFKFATGWEYVTAVVTAGKGNKQIVKKIDQYCLDFFDSFGKDLKQGGPFEGVLDNLKKSVRQTLK